MFQWKNTLLQYLLVLFSASQLPFPGTIPRDQSAPLLSVPTTTCCPPVKYHTAPSFLQPPKSPTSPRAAAPLSDDLHMRATVCTSPIPCSSAEHLPLCLGLASVQNVTLGAPRPGALVRWRKWGREKQEFGIKSQKWRALSFSNTN